MRAFTHNSTTSFLPSPGTRLTLFRMLHGMGWGMTFVDHLARQGRLRWEGNSYLLL